MTFAMWFNTYIYYILTGFPKLASLKAKASKTLFRPIKPTNPSVRMACKAGKPVLTTTEGKLSLSDQLYLL